MQTGEQLAVMFDVHYGLRDRDKPMLWFTVKNLDGYESLQWFYQPRADEIIAQSGVSDIVQLNNKACVITIENRTMHFVKVFRLDDD